MITAEIKPGALVRLNTARNWMTRTELGNETPAAYGPRIMFNSGSIFIVEQRGGYSEGGCSLWLFQPAKRVWVRIRYTGFRWLDKI